VGIDFGSLVGGATSIVASSATIRAQIEWARIQDKPTDIEIQRENVDGWLPTQTVRIEYDSSKPSDASDASGISAFKGMYVFGVRGHPTVPDLDIDGGDIFVLDDQEYTVISVNKRIIGQIQAYCEAVG
jgi:hypothetical protein